MNRNLPCSKPGITQYLVLFFLMISINGTNAQNTHDTIYKPKIGINSLNDYGPYVVGTKRNNEFIVYNLPEHTSKVILKFIDVYGEQIGQSNTTEGADIKDIIWKVESSTLDLPLSPRFSAEVYYQSDSLAIYNIPYIVYPDTAVFYASAGWGPFITNNYDRTDTSWHDVPQQLNSFSVSNLPPRTDTVKFVISSANFTTIDSFYVIAEKGQYLDSASFENVS